MYVHMERSALAAPPPVRASILSDIEVYFGYLDIAAEPTDAQYCESDGVAKYNMCGSEELNDIAISMLRVDAFSTMCLQLAGYFVYPKPIFSSGRSTC
jgi:hypothetical protein